MRQARSNMTGPQQQKHNGHHKPYPKYTEKNMIATTNVQRGDNQQGSCSGRTSCVLFLPNPTICRAKAISERQHQKTQPKPQTTPQPIQNCGQRTKQNNHRTIEACQEHCTTLLGLKSPRQRPRTNRDKPCAILKRSPIDTQTTLKQSPDDTSRYLFPCIVRLNR